MSQRTSFHVFFSLYIGWIFIVGMTSHIYMGATQLDKLGNCMLRYISSIVTIFEFHLLERRVHF